MSDGTRRAAVRLLAACEDRSRFRKSFLRWL